MRSSSRRLVLGMTVSVLATLSGVRLVGSSTTWDLGDLFVAVGGGAYQIRDSTGALKDPSLTLVTAGGVSRGCALDSSLNLYTVNAANNAIAKYPFGTTQSALTISTLPLTSPQSIVFDAADNFYVGFAGGAIQKYNAAGTAQGTLQVPVDTTASFWMDLAADRRTMFYTSGGQTVRTVDLVTGSTSLFATIPPPNSSSDQSFALRLLRPTPADGPGALIGGLLLAHGTDIKLLSSTGVVLRTYDAVDGKQTQDAWFALALTPDDIHPADRAFWAGDLATGKIWRFRIDGPGTPETGRNTGTPSVGGLCINAEPTQGQYTQILSLSPSSPSGAAIFNQGNSVEQHQFGMSFASLGSPVRIVVSAREAVSDGACAVGDPSDVDCGFVSFFSADPILPQGVPYVHGRGVYYRAEALRTLNTPAEIPTVNITSVHNAASLLTAAGAGACGVDSTGQPIRRAARLFHDPTETPEIDQFDVDITLSFYVDEWGESGIPPSGSRYIAAFRCATGTAVISRPPAGRTYSAGQSVPLEVDLLDAQGHPITDANNGQHDIVVTLGFSGQVLNTLNTPGSSFNFFKQVQPGIYRANLDTSGLHASSLPYNVCISDFNASPTSAELPKYPNQCVSFLLK